MRRHIHHIHRRWRRFPRCRSVRECSSPLQSVHIGTARCGHRWCWSLVWRTDSPPSTASLPTQTCLHTTQQCIRHNTVAAADGSSRSCSLNVSVDFFRKSFQVNKAKDWHSHRQFILPECYVLIACSLQTVTENAVAIVANMIRLNTLTVSHLNSRFEFCY